MFMLHNIQSTVDTSNQCFGSSLTHGCQICTVLGSGKQTERWGLRTAGLKWRDAVVSSHAEQGVTPELGKLQKQAKHLPRKRASEPHYALMLASHLQEQQGRVACYRCICRSADEYARQYISSSLRGTRLSAWTVASRMHFSVRASWAHVWC